MSDHVTQGQALQHYGNKQWILLNYYDFFTMVRPGVNMPRRMPGDCRVVRTELIRLSAACAQKLFKNHK